MITIQPATTLDQLIATKGAPTGNPFVDGLVEFLRLNASNTVEDAANYLGVPERLLREAIHFFVGVTVREVIHRWRAMQALDLLDDPALSLDAICKRLHFASPKVLRAMMRTYYGTTIGMYRDGKLRRNGNFDYNETKESRQTAIRNAQQLKKRNDNE